MDFNLPASPSRPGTNKYRGAFQSQVLAKTLSDALTALSRQMGSPLCITLLAAFQTLLHRYTGQENIVLRLAIASRRVSETNKLIGSFANTVVVRTNLSGDPTFEELLKQVRSIAPRVYANQGTDFDERVGALESEREPLVRLEVQLRNRSHATLDLSDLKTEEFEFEDRTSRFDFSLDVHKKVERLNCLFEYDADLFDASTIKRMLGHFQILLEGIVANPDARLWELPLLTQAERHQLLVEWNNTHADYPKDSCIHELFEAQVERTPDAVAVVFEDQQLTYRQLNRRANQLAHYLRSLGVGPEVLVGILMERSLEMVIALYGILKAGGAYVPLDPEYPSERLVFMVGDTKVPVLLTQKHLVDKLPENQAQSICLDSGWEVIARESDTNLGDGASADNPAYVIYTSGSTGQPKGVINTHRSICNRLLWMQDAYDLEAQDRVLQKTPFSFDVSVWEFFWPLLNGACLVVARPEGHRDNGYLRATIIERNITTLHFVPSMLQAFLEEPGLGDCRSLKRVICSGEALSLDLQKRFFSRHSAELHNLYGPTEAAVDVTYWACEPGGKRSIVPIGRPVANTTIYILDYRLQPVPVGVPGELHIGGVQVARGYLNRPDLTAEKFIPDPFSDETGARLYKTGDLARYLPDGNIEFLGRMDGQVKIRGFRIELGEIEAVLGQHPAIQDTVAMARDAVGGDKRLVAYVVPKQTEAPTTSELRSFLKDKLPDFMMPSAFVILDAIPLTPNGKVDHKALPEANQARPDLEGVFMAPRTPEEELLAGIWTEVLRLEQVGVHDNFFELGGDSILGLQIVARASEAGLRLTSRQIFQHPTVAELVMVADTTPPVRAQQQPVLGPVPLTPIQQWFFEQNLPDPHHWNQAMLLEVRQALDPPLLERVIQQLIAHHDALRLRFVLEEGGWQQVNAGVEGVVPFTQVDLSALSEDDQGRAIEAKATKLQASLNLSEGPLLRVALFDLGPSKPGRLLMVIHHLLVDGVSWRILLEDLQRAYQQLSRGEAIQLPPKTTSFQYWARRLTEYAQSASLREELSHWLAGPRTKVSPIPVDYAGGANTESSASTVSVSLGAEETKALLQEIHQAYHTHINDVLLTALVQAFAQWTGSRNLLIDLEGHGREEIVKDVDLSRTVGWFTSIFPVLLDLGQASDPGDAVKLVKEQLRGIPINGIGYGLLHYLSGDADIVETLQTLPRAEVSFNYLGQFDQVFLESSLIRQARESSGPEHSLQGARPHLLYVMGHVIGGQLQLAWTYSKNIHRRSTIEQLASDYLEALRSNILHCQSPEAGGYTPSDFPEAKLTQKDLDKLCARISQAARGTSE